MPSRFSVIGWALITSMLGLNIFNVVNQCYCGASCGYDCSAFNIGGGNPVDFTKHDSHKLIDYEITPFFQVNKLVTNVNGTPINTSNNNETAAYMADVASYAQPRGLIDTFDAVFFFSLSAIKILLNTFIMPVTSLPYFLTSELSIPAFISYPIGIVLSILMVISIVEFVTGKTW